MARPTRATYLRRRAVAVLCLFAVVVGIAVAVGAMGGGDDAPTVRTAPRAATHARPRPRTDVAAVASRAHVPVLCYHQIRALTTGDAAQDRVYIVPPKVLDAQLGALERAGYHTVSARDVAAHMAVGRRLPSKPVLLTFDDASAGQRTRALPILRRHGFTATFFVMTVVLDNPGWLTRTQVRELDRAGMEIGAHTWDHRAVPGYGGKDWRVQLTEPKAELERIVGHPVAAFAFPFGAWNAAAFAPLRDAGVKIAFQLSEALDPQAPMLTTRRILVGPDVSGGELLRMVRQDF